MSAPRKPSVVRKRRRFASAFAEASGARYARAYSLTPEAGDFLASLRLCDSDDLASALLALTAEMDVSDADGGVADDEAIKVRLSELRLEVEEGAARSSCGAPSAVM